MTDWYIGSLLGRENSNGSSSQNIARDYGWLFKAKDADTAYLRLLQEGESRVSRFAANWQLSGISDLFGYDAEHLEVSFSATGTSYSYDGNGQRVLKAGGGVSTVYVYDAAGALAAEYSSATPGSSPCTTCYVSVDHLGSVRMVTDQSGTVVARHDYLAFGEEIGAGYAGRTNAGLWGASDNADQRFTGQVRDVETGLDYFNARYYESPLGRFMSPDPENAGTDATNPQTWNAYVYGVNSPLSGTDPSGLNWFTDFFANLGSFLLGPDPSEGNCSVDFCATGTTTAPVETSSAGVVSGFGGGSGGSGSGGSGGGGLGIAQFFTTVTGQSGGSPVSNSVSSVPPTNGTRNCSATPASAGQYAAATAQVALLTGQFFSGFGSADQNFGPNTATSQVMAQSGPVQGVLNDYTMTGRTSNLYTFGASGYVAAGANPVAQFVGSFRYTISPTNGGIDLRLTNTTSFKSLTYDKGPQWQRGPVPTPMGNTHQVYNIFVPCGG